MAASISTAVPFGQGQDVARLRAVVDRSTKEFKDYAEQYKDQRAIVEAETRHPQTAGAPTRGSSQP
jgi:hypothetical protein